MNETNPNPKTNPSLGSAQVRSHGHNVAINLNWAPYGLFHDDVLPQLPNQVATRFSNDAQLSWSQDVLLEYPLRVQVMSRAKVQCEAQPGPEIPMDQFEIRGMDVDSEPNQQEDDRDDDRDDDDGEADLGRGGRGQDRDGDGESARGDVDADGYGEAD